jgi:threonylcarbamoyladenosine tRNA methylthiotransferase MtaB
MRISIITLGCKTNQAESFSIEADLKRDGNDIVDIADTPDLCIINTCTVTAKADQQSRQLIRKALRNNAKVIVTGCYAELNADKIKKIDGAIDIVNNDGKLHIINKITDHNSTNLHINSRYPRHRPIVKVQDGCNFSCSYCSIPKARGISRSESCEDIIDKINQYCEAGYKEVVLTGIHLGTYGLDLQPRKSLSFLLKGILKETNICRIRLSSLAINEINDELLDIISDGRICKHLHIPLQSGEDTILRKMNRTYSTGDFTLKMDLITKRFPNIAIGTDVITGFPGESEESFLKTCRFMEAMPFSYVHVFPYSSRPGTLAATFKDQIPENIKKQRVSILKTIGDSKKTDYLIGHLDQILEIVVEDRTAEGYVGTSANYIKVLLPHGIEFMNETLMNIKVTGYKNHHALGIPINTLKPVNI